ncbi:MAG: HAMP domain-containing sensor histidine kinase [bacterium]
MINITSKYASPERINNNEIFIQNSYLKSLPNITSILDSLSTVAVILNHERQVLYSNPVLLNLLNINNAEDIYGKRPGEILNCVNSKIEPEGCGTSENCRFCGAVNSIIESQKLNTKVSKECRISASTSTGLTSYDFLITSTPFLVNNKSFTILSLSDISEQKRKRALEKIFFHDVINTAGGLNGFIDYLRDSNDENEVKELLDDISRLSTRLLDEIISQRDLASAETGELAVIPNIIEIDSLIEEIIKQISYHDVFKGKTISNKTNSKDTTIATDKRLLSRVLTNMLKNAFEATPKGEKVSIGTEIKDKTVLFWVHNSLCMPKEIQAQVFQRSFSTKAPNRGLGTYSMKLLTEKYLGGKIYFKSNIEEGTTFTIEIPIIPNS